VASGDSYPTAPREHDARRQRVAMWGRRCFVALLLTFVVLAFANVFGVRSATASASGGGYELEVQYPRVTRPGLASPLTFTIRRTDGGPLPGELSLETTTGYLAMFDYNELYPEPTEIRADGGHVLWVLQPQQDATEMRIALDARIQPSSQWGRDGETTLYAQDDAVTTVGYHTWVLP